MMQSQTDSQLMATWQNSPILFVEDVWGLVPQPLKLEYRTEPLAPDEYAVYMFEPFIRGKHYTWQQFVLFQAIEWAIQKRVPRKIAIESGVGVGKTTALAMLIIWFLFTHPHSIVPCTAPTAPQMDDALWKELKLWLTKMPEPLQYMFEWSSGYLRVVESRETWFARARTASKDRPEALAGIHADDVLLIVDEASGVVDEVFEIGQGVFSGENVYAILISQHQRLTGYFHQCFNVNKRFWQNYRFNAEESPISDPQLRENIIHEKGIESDTYRVQVLGMPPKEDGVDDRGYVPLFTPTDLHMCLPKEFIGRVKMGVDPAGEGSNETVWVIRDKFKARKVASEKTSTPLTIAQKTLTLMRQYGVNAGDVYVDNFGIGANVAQQLAFADQMVNAVNTGDKAEEDTVYINKRAEIAWRVKEWIRKGGELVQDKSWDELLNIRYHSNLRGLLAIMSKDLMRKEGIDSPDTWDALALTFWDVEEWGSVVRTHVVIDTADEVDSIL